MLDGGITNGGLPYFAMELVDGEPIDRYCQSRDLSIDQRIDLFGRVCDAVSYAHRIVERAFPENGVRVRRHLLRHDAERHQRDQG